MSDEGRFRAQTTAELQLAIEAALREARSPAERRAAVAEARNEHRARQRGPLALRNVTDEGFEFAS